VVIKIDRSDKIEIKKFFLKISGHQQRRPRPLPGAILIPPALLVVADSSLNNPRCIHPRPPRLDIIGF